MRTATFAQRSFDSLIPPPPASPRRTSTIRKNTIPRWTFTRCVFVLYSVLSLFLICADVRRLTPLAPFTSAHTGIHRTREDRPLQATVDGPLQRLEVREGPQAHPLHRARQHRDSRQRQPAVVRFIHRPTLWASRLTPTMIGPCFNGSRTRSPIPRSSSMRGPTPTRTKRRRRMWNNHIARRPGGR